MAFLNILYLNHLDLTWRRPRYTAAETSGISLVPYSEIQEKQLDAGLDFARNGGCYCIEQTITLREYIARNPDVLPEVTEMLADGRLKLLGGGEAVIDYNLPDGESIIRNHLYSRRWLKAQFGFTPSLACCPDTFGLSANLPALFRALGYRGISQYNRVFQNAKPVWQGISGDRIALETAKLSPRPTFGIGSFVKSRVCGCCGGHGCPECGGSGFIAEYVPRRAADALALTDTARSLSRNGTQDVNLIINGEENMTPSGICPVLQEVANKAGLTPRFIGYDELETENYHELLDRLDTLPSDMLDTRREGNPVASGCYTTRIRLKQENRRCEAALRAAESISVAASLSDTPCPVKTLETLWQKLAFLQFHDALPASHSDGAYAELMETARQIRVSACRVINRAANALMREIVLPKGEGIPFIVFNPLEFDVKNAPLTASVKLEPGVRNGIIAAPDGSRLAPLSIKRGLSPESDAALVTFFGDLPAFGYGVFRFLPSDEAPAGFEPAARGAVMENEYLRVELDDYGVHQIIDKRSNTAVACEGSFSPVLSDDAGHPWGRTNSIQYRERADKPDYWENMTPPRVYSHSVSRCRRGNLQLAEIKTAYSREEKQIELLDWTAMLVLADGSDDIFVRITTAFDARDIKLSTQVVLPPHTETGKLDYEIPLGRIAREHTEVYDSQLGFADEWPALRYVSAEAGGKRVTLCNNGTPGHSLENNIIRVSLLRTPTQLCCAYGVKGAIDRGTHTFDFTLSSALTPIEEYRRGMTLNAYYPSYSDTQCPTAEAPASGSFMKLPDDAPLLALKGAEDGDGYIARYLGNEAPTTLRFDAPVERASILEYDRSAPQTSIELTPYSITTLHISKDNLK